VSLHHPEEVRQQLIRSCSALGIGPALVPEPEVLGRQLAGIQCKTLTGLIVSLLNENEPLLHAESDGTTVTVRDRGGDAVMCFTVEAARG